VSPPPLATIVVSESGVVVADAVTCERASSLTMTSK
jgi:hypothetical protein